MSVAHSSVSSLISAIEHREIIDPAFVVFRYAIFYQAEKCREISNSFFSAILPVLPVDPPPNLKSSEFVPRSLRLPREEDLQKIEGLLKEQQSKYQTLSNFLSDLSREAQNRLVGDFFRSEKTAQVDSTPPAACSVRIA